MGMETLIRDNILKERLKAECLVVYDPDRHYRDLCLQIAMKQSCICLTGVKPASYPTSKEDGFYGDFYNTLMGQ